MLTISDLLDTPSTSTTTRKAATQSIQLQCDHLLVQFSARQDSHLFQHVVEAYQCNFGDVLSSALMQAIPLCPITGIANTHLLCHKNTVKDIQQVIGRANEQDRSTLMHVLGMQTRVKDGAPLYSTKSIHGRIRTESKFQDVCLAKTFQRDFLSLHS